MRVASLVSSSAPDAGRSTSRGRPRRAYAARRGRLPALILALAGLMCLLAAPLQAVETIAAIEITGNRTVEADVIRSHLKLARGSPYDAASADQSIKAL